MTSVAAEQQLIRVGHSPDPDDAFMFHALANAKIDTGRYRFEHTLQDIETLNRRAFQGELELTAVSLHAYAFLTDKYALCSCGASMGDNYGPMVVARDAGSIADLKGKRIAVPGTLTTAFLTLKLLLGDSFTYEVHPFDEIFGGERVLPDDEAFELLDRRHHRLRPPFQRRLADAVDSGVGVELDEDEVGARSVGRAADRRVARGPLAA